MRNATLLSIKAFSSSPGPRRLLTTMGTVLFVTAFGCAPEGEPFAPVMEYAGTWTLARVEGKSLPAVKSISDGSPYCCGDGTMNLESVTVTQGTLVMYNENRATLDYRITYKSVSGGEWGSTERHVLEWDEKDGRLRFFESKPCNNAWVCPSEALLAEATTNGVYLEFSHAFYPDTPSFIQHMNKSSFMRKP